MGKLCAEESALRQELQEAREMHNKLLSLSFLFILTISANNMTAQGSDAQLTPEQLICLMKASKERYISIEAKMQATRYQYADDNSIAVIQSNDDIISRWRKDKHYSRTIRTEYTVENSPVKDVYVNLVTKKESKEYRLQHNGLRLGNISLTTEGDLPFVTIHLAMWSSNNIIESINLSTATVYWDKEKNLYILKSTYASKTEPPSIRLFFDPSKDFIPVRREYMQFDGTVFHIEECSDFEKTPDGLWVPYRYSWYTPHVRYGGVYTVETMTVNEPIAEDKFNFEFPPGTKIYDEFLKVHRRIPDSNSPNKLLSEIATSKEEPNVPGDNDITITSAAKETELLGAAQKASRLLAEYSEPQEIKTPSIEVSPSIVLVTVDKSQYKIFIKASEGLTPVLLSQSFEGYGLTLSSLNNLTDNQEGQLIVNVKRLQSHTGFASGTLLLLWAGQNSPTEITFVSVPMQ